MAADGPTPSKPKQYAYTPINELSAGPSLNFYGRVVHLRPPAPTRGTDYVMNMIVVDDSLSFNPDVEAVATGLTVVIFRPDPALFPAVKTEDEIVQFRHMRIQEFQGSLQALSTNWSAFTVFSRSEAGQWVARPERSVEPEESQLLNRISAKTGHTAAVVRSSPKRLQINRQLLTLDLLRPDVFFDFIAQVIQVLPATKPNQTILLLSDYTLNPAVQTNPLAFGLPPNLEHRLLPTAFWDNFAEQAACLREGHVIRIINLRTKLISAPAGKDISSGGLFAVLHGDRSSTEKIFVLPKSSPEAKAIEDRRVALFGDDGDGSNIFTSTPTKSPLKRVSAVLANHSPTDITQSARLSFTSTSNSQIYPLTTVMHPDIPITAIKTVREAQEVPAKFIIRGRVIGHQPAAARDICRPYCRSCAQSVPWCSTMANCSNCGARLSEYVFMMTIDVTDGIDTISIIIAYQDAVRFFNGMIPHDLHADQATASYLEAALKTLIESPIPCSFCIKSYVSGSVRRYRLFDTLLAIQ